MTSSMHPYYLRSEKALCLFNALFIPFSFRPAAAKFMQGQEFIAILTDIYFYQDGKLFTQGVILFTQRVNKILSGQKFIYTRSKFIYTKSKFIFIRTKISFRPYIIFNASLSIFGSTIIQFYCCPVAAKLM
jgi:hypothetical protein